MYFKLPLITAVAFCSGVAHAATATTTDGAFVAKVSRGGMFEVAAGKLAETRASTQDVRDFATAEVHDHTLVGDKLKAISSAERLPIARTPSVEFATKLAHLSSLSGAAFDAEYLSDMAVLHDSDGAAFAQEAIDGGSAAFGAFGAETHKIVQRHIGAINGAPVPSDG